MPGNPELWTLRLEAASAGNCREIEIRDWPEGSDLPALEGVNGVHGWLCRGDAGLACCVSALVDAEEEVVFETGTDHGQMCVVNATARQGSVSEFRRAAEEAFDHPATTIGYLP